MNCTSIQKYLREKHPDFYDLLVEDCWECGLLSGAPRFGITVLIPSAELLKELKKLAKDNHDQLVEIVQSLVLRRYYSGFDEMQREFGNLQTRRQGSKPGVFLVLDVEKIDGSGAQLRGGAKISAVKLSDKEKQALSGDDARVKVAVFEITAAPKLKEPEQIGAQERSGGASTNQHAGLRTLTAKFADFIIRKRDGTASANEWDPYTTAAFAILLNLRKKAANGDVNTYRKVLAHFDTNTFAFVHNIVLEIPEAVSGFNYAAAVVSGCSASQCLDAIRADIATHCPQLVSDSYFAKVDTERVNLQNMQLNARNLPNLVSAAYQRVYSACPSPLSVAAKIRMDDRSYFSFSRLDRIWSDKLDQSIHLELDQLCHKMCNFEAGVANPSSFSAQVRMGNPFEAQCRLYGFIKSDCFIMPPITEQYIRYLQAPAGNNQAKGTTDESRLMDEGDMSIYALHVIVEKCAHLHKGEDDCCVTIVTL